MKLKDLNLIKHKIFLKKMTMINKNKWKSQ